MTRPNDDDRIAAALVGAWRLVSWTIEYPASGRVTQPFGAVPEGLLVYSADGHMSAAIQRPGRARLSRADPNAVSDAEKAAAFAGYLQYSGTWSMADGRVVRHFDCFRRTSVERKFAGRLRVRAVAFHAVKPQVALR